MKSILFAGALLAAAPATAQHTGHGGAGDGAAAEAFRAANARMHAGMAIAFTGDADVDFARGMIAHHQGAIDMARIVLEHGDNPEIRALAEAIVAAQETEIAAMKAWLEKNAPQ